MARNTVKTKPGFACHETEYKVLNDQRLAVIRSYNMWYAFGHAVAHGYFWLLLVIGLDLSSQPLVLAAPAVATLIVWFAYKAILVIDRGMIWLYPRLIFLELILDYHSYRDYLRRRPRGDSERAFIETYEQIHAASPADLWDQINSQFKERDFPADRRITGHFKWAAFLSVALFWVIVAIILQPIYFPLSG
jgi:hypothetical protein